MADIPGALPDDILEVVEERVAIGVRRADRGGVRVTTRTVVEAQTVRDTLTDWAVEVERVPQGRFVEAAEGPRTDGDLTILPVYEERLIVQTRLWLVEEVHLRRRATPREHEVPVEVRRQVAEVERLPPDPSRDTQPDPGVTTMADTTYGTQTVTALFDTEAEAERAVARLRAAGIPDSAIRVTAGSSEGVAESGYGDRHKGFWESLGDFFFPDEDRYAYAEGLSRGGVLVAVTDFDAAHYDAVVDILDDEGSVDLSEREAEWRSTGYADYRSSDYYDEDEYARTHRAGASDIGYRAAGAAGMAAATTGAGVDAALGGAGSRGTIHDDGVSDRQMAADVSGRTAYAGATAATDLDDEGTVKVVEERLSVGKREAEGGRVRVRTYVREEPVSADVDLRSTRVFLERRPVDRAASSADVAFQDRSIEARESVEEAVVAKEARVVEEIGLRQESDVRTETISDTVRKTEVEIEDERTGEVTRVGGDAAATDRERF